MTGLGRLAELGRIVDATVEALGGVAATSVGSRATSPQSGIPGIAVAPAPWQPGPDLVAATAAAGAATTAGRPAGRGDLAGLHVVVTAGGTVEPIDPVRFVGNRSTGKMGMAVAEAALDRGAAVTLILGNTTVEPPARAHLARAETAAEMQAALRALTPPEGPRFDVLIMAAAVADFRPRSAADHKIGRADGLTLEMDSTPDLLAETAERVRTGIRGSGARRPILVGFAAETGSLDRAAEKLKNKGVDLLAANDVTEPGSGFATDTNKVTIYSVDSAPEELPLMSKREVAELLLDRVVVRLLAAVGGESAAPVPAPAPAPAPELTEAGK
jgi:phosphopantothenoylcysteine decarboxylase/phosphopantothenate--cysteine ligase